MRPFPIHEQEQLTELHVANIAPAVVEQLGGQRVFTTPITTDVELHEVVRAGLPSAALEYFLRGAMSLEGAREAVLRLLGEPHAPQESLGPMPPQAPGASAHHSVASDRRLTPVASDKLARAARIVVRAADSLGNRKKAWRWLMTPNRALHGKQPIDLVATDAGTIAVDDVLGRLEQGIVG